MARILILREPDAAVRTAAFLRERGHEPLLLPVQAIRRLDPAMPAGPFGGFIATSAHAAPYVEAHLAGDGRPFLAVGGASAEALRRAGAVRVVEGDGTGKSLAAAARTLVAERGLPLLYLAGRVRTDGLETALVSAGVPFEPVEVYDTERLVVGKAGIDAAIGPDGANAVLVLSVVQAQAFIDLAIRFAERFAPPPTPLCLSQRIADALPPPWRDRSVVAPRPELSALIEHYALGVRG